MTRFLPITIAVLTCLFCMTSVFVYDVSADTVSEHDGYYITEGSIGFRSYDDFIQNKEKAYDKIKGSDCSGELYLSDYDYIYVPTKLKDSLDKITDIQIAPRNISVKFGKGDSMVFSTYFYSDYNKKENHEYTNFAVPNGKKETVNGVDYYLYDHPYEGGYYCNDHGKYFYFSSSINPKDSDGQPLTKVYLDNHLSETDGKLYYINDNGEKESGWKNIGNHRYYFRSSDKAAICGKTAKIGGIVYRFNANGVCKGKYTGYAKENGKKVYYKDGVAAK